MLTLALVASLMAAPGWFIPGPAIFTENGVQSHYLDGKLHNADGPAVVYADGAQEYWLDGELQTPAGYVVGRKRY